MTRPEGREGIVTVYDDQDHYLGCMGRELWEQQLRDGKTLRKVAEDYDRRMSTRWGRFLLWLLRKTTKGAA